MELLGFIWIPNFIIWIAALAFLVYLYGNWPYSKLAKYGYRGPKTKIFMGNIDKVFIRDDYFAKFDLTGKQLYGKIYSMYEGRIPSLVCFDTDVLKQVLVKEFQNFQDRRPIFLRGKVKNSIFDLHGAEWRRVRNLLSPFFTTGKIKKNMDCLQYCCDNMQKKLDGYAEKSEMFEAKEIAGAYSLEAICGTAFGLQIDSQSDPDHVLLKTMKGMSTTKGGLLIFTLMFCFPGVMPWLDWFGFETWGDGAIDMLTKLTRVAVEERKKSNQERPDFIQAMIKAHKVELDNETKRELGENLPDLGKGLTEDEIIAQAAIFMLAGYDTTSGVVSFMMYNMAAHPEWQEKVYKELEEIFGDEEVEYDKLKETMCLDMCICESQRVFPSVFRVDRMCINDTTINGHFIPEGTMLTIPIYGLHHDPELWDDPETYDPERFNAENKDKIDPYSYQPFGLGPRHCVAMRLAQVEVKLAIIMVLRKYKLTIADKMEMPLKLAISFVPRAKGGIWLNLEKR